ncbi:DUF4347 domain-containing protein [Nisaea sp.]|uniref:DUF4347 domain-containing protein n=1 Tax=Nisaea sp. TaxID=2024842 RepID=UPI003B5263D4
MRTTYAGRHSSAVTIAQVFETQESGGQYGEGAASPAGRALILVDPRVDGHRKLTAELEATADIRIADPERDGLEQIAEALAATGSVNALYIVAHGAPGRVFLGAAAIDSRALTRNHDTVAAIRERLHGADLHLVSCDTGRGVAGRDFVTALSHRLDAPVAAFSGSLGAGHNGGNLRTAGGPTHRASLFSRAALAAHPTLLANSNVTSDGGGTSIGTFGGIWADLNPPRDSDTIYFHSGVDSIDLTSSVSITSSASHHSATSTTLTISSGTSQTISVAAGKSFTIGYPSSSTDQTFIVSAKITGAGGVTANKASLTLSGSNDFSGDLKVTGGGSVSVGATSNFGSGTVTLDNGTLIGSGGNPDASGNFTIGSGGGTLQVDGGILTLDGTISDGSAGHTLTKSGSAVAILEGVSSDFTGTVNVTAGSLVVDASGADSALAKATFNVTTGSLQLNSDETIGGLTGSGTVSMPAGDLTIDQSADTTFSGVISGSNGITKSGDGILTLSGDNTYNGAFGSSGAGTVVADGTLVVAGSLANNNAILVQSGGTLALKGTSNGGVNLADGGQLGQAGTYNGTLEVSGTTTLGVAGGTSSTFHIDVESDGSGGYRYDALKGNTTFTIADTNLTVVSDGSTSIGDTLTIIDNTSVGAISGTFNNLSEGATLSAGGHTYRISYVGGTGNDVTLEHIAAPSSGGSSGGNSGGGLSVTDQTAEDASGAATGHTLVNNSGSSATGALVQNTGNGNLVTATLPSGVSLTNKGTSSAEVSSTATTTLTGEIRTTEPDTTDQSFLDGHGQTFLSKMSGMEMDIRSISFSSSEASAQTVQITGQSSSGGEAFVIDTTGLPSGSTLQLDNIEFAAIVGNATVSGGAGQNYVVGDDARQFISLGAEDDTLAGGAGEDTVGSSWGEDILYGNQGTDLVFGGGGMDTVYGGQDADTVRGDNDNDWVYGNKGDDTLSGGNGEDLLFGGQNDDIVYGNAGDDSISGNLGSDSLYGGQGNDLISGGDGADILAGNKGDDTLSGGEGADIFVFEFDGGNDQLADFQAGTDTLALESGLAVAGGTESGGNTTVTFSDGGTVTVIGVGKTDLAAATGWEFG